ncbi:AraC family transcriptional regulator [Flavobacterium sp. WLB]|uniref:GyrI-like domain-containing protein n=1 Tax=unclassified Flavobacterium TaxID=196869 RepID=UPI0006AB7C98|nr:MULTISPECIES: GyrI-like domain-containing protein [unclassified Flavobacterium]KOP39131.1 AraC family transcriptional regulator [Flavobacterium sp. VMW]OWU89210.1 AraC family transcriptional regulator [Flavobacterium sp. NLM]PUU68335.1 AraC family transcriptional regulator [Flavobacterium sp. WLB]
MEARIETLTEKKLIGQHIEMSFIENKTFQLWSNFMPKRKQIKNTINENLYSLEVFSHGHFDNFDPGKTFQKWAAVEVGNYDEVPSEMETLIIPDGLYAVFIHYGPASEGHKTYHTIFAEWLPNSKYTVDDRPHFAVMDHKYKKEDPESEEEIWIPIKNRD